MYLYQFIIPSTGISDATTENLKRPQKIFLGSFTSSLQWAGRNCSRFLILINLLCFPGTINDLHLKTALFPVFYSPIFRLFFAHFYLFYQSQWAASHSTSTSVNSECTKYFCKSKLVFLAYLLQWFFGHNFSVTKA